MTKGLFGLLQRMEEHIASAARVPLVGKSMVDAEELLELLEKLRAALPDEVHQAQWVVSEKDRILVEAGEEARRMRREGQEYVNRLVEDHRLVHEAEQQASRILAEARQEAVRIRAEAEIYAGKVLAQLEQGLVRATTVVQRSREELAASSGEE